VLRLCRWYGSTCGRPVFLLRLHSRLSAKPDRPNGLHHLSDRAIRWLDRLHILLCLRRGFLRCVHRLRFLYNLRRWHGSAFRRPVFLLRLHSRLSAKPDRPNGLHHLSNRAIRWLDRLHVLLCLRRGFLLCVHRLRFLLCVYGRYGSVVYWPIFLHRLHRRLSAKHGRTGNLPGVSRRHLPDHIRTTILRQLHRMRQRLHRRYAGNRHNRSQLRAERMGGRL